MPKDYSPFTPGSPVDVQFFVGRQAEIDLLKRKIVNSISGRVQVGFLIGERGIGKSSLASFVKYIVERDERVVGIHALLGGVSSLGEMVRRILDRLIRESENKEWYGKIKEFFGNHIKQVGLPGFAFQFDAKPKELEELANDFAPSLRKLYEKLRNDKKAIFIILDDINGLAHSPKFANWLKSLVDEIATSRQPLPLCLLLVGYDEKRHSLISSQPLLSRIFDLIEIKAWRTDETKEFFQRAFLEVGIRIDNQALVLLARFSGGLPVLAHEIGDAVFNSDSDNHIDTQDAIDGIKIAAEIVGRKHLEPQIFRAIQSKKYLTILRKVVQDPFGFEFKRREVIRRLREDEVKVFDNFLVKMTKLGMLMRIQEEGQGFYRFANLLYFFSTLLEMEKEKLKNQKDT